MKGWWISFAYRAVNEYVAAIPGMPDVEKFATIGTVGLTLSSCTTTGVRTRHLTAIRPTTFTSNLSRSRRLHNRRSSTYPDRENCLNLWGHLSTWSTVTAVLP